MDHEIDNNNFVASISFMLNKKIINLMIHSISLDLRTYAKMCISKKKKI